MKILVISGFLGAGKTTFIKELSARIKIKPVILENEYASVNVDENILKSGTDLSVWESTENCICCNGRSDFAFTILTIANSLDPEYLIVEPTGVGYLSKVMENISKMEYERISALSPVTVIDPMSFERGLKQYKDLYLDHIRYAGTIILSKCDLIRDRGIINGVKEKLSEINPDADIISTDYRNAGDDLFSGLFDDRKPGMNISLAASIEREEPDFEELSILNAGMESIGELVFFMEELIRFRYGHIIRAKGTVKVNNELIRADISDTRYLLSQAEKTAKQGFVLIGEEIDKESLRMRLGFTPLIPIRYNSGVNIINPIDKRRKNYEE